MSKEVIAVDIDDVVVNVAQRITDHYNQTYGAELSLADYYSRDLSLLKVPDIDTAIQRFYKYLESDEFFVQPPAEEAIKNLDTLRQSYDLYAVTGRHRNMREQTKMWLNTHLPDVFQECVFTEYYSIGREEGFHTKAAICQRIAAIALIEDHIGHAIEVAEAGIQVYLFGEYPWNASNSLPANILRVKNWQEVITHLVPSHEPTG